MRRVVTSVVTAVVAPTAVLWVGLSLCNFTTAVIGALAWMVAAMLWRWATHRPVSGLLALALGLLMIRTTLTLVTGSPFIYFIQPVFADLFVAGVFLGSLCSSRSMVARLAGDFYPLDTEVAARPGIRALFRGLTVLWGAAIIVKAGITLTLLQTLSTVDFVVIKGAIIVALTISTAVVTVAWSIVIGRREDLLW